MSASADGQEPPVGIICGAGDFPVAVANALAAQGRSAFMVGLKGSAEPSIEAWPHTYVGVAEPGKLFAALRAKNVSDVVIVGPIVRPHVADLRPDLGSLKFLPAAIRMLRGGDDTLLGSITRFIESEGFCVRGVHELAPGLLAGEGALTKAVPDTDALGDIRLGCACLGALSPFDIGQAVIVAGGRVLALEAAEGTDAMIARVADMRASGRLRLKGRAGVLIKAPKIGQDLRVDLPAIGPRTLEAAAAAQLAGIAVAAGKVLMLNRATLAADAARAGLYVHGFKP